MGRPLGLLSEPVTDRLSHLPPSVLRTSDLDAAVTERIFGPLGAAIQASVFSSCLATHPELRAEQNRLEAAEAALDDGVEPVDPRVEELAVLRCAQQMSLEQLDRAEEKLFEIYDADLKGEEDTRMSAVEAVIKMPYGFSPARMRCMERTERLLAEAHSADSCSPAPGAES